MEGFTINDIYDTKGIEYLFVIGYLLILIVFWRMMRKPGKVLVQFREAVSTLSSNILKIPQGIFFNRNHTWAHLGEAGTARVGMDDFLQHVIGRMEVKNLKQPGVKVNKGDILADIIQEGKRVSIHSPISGEVTDLNEQIVNQPDLINVDPYDEGWICRIKPTDWHADTNSCLLADDATEWSESEMLRFKDFLSGDPLRKFSGEPSMVMLQDGGEIKEHVLTDLPEEVWRDFQKEFLS